MDFLYFHQEESSSMLRMASKNDRNGLHRACFLGGYGEITLQSILKSLTGTLEGIL